MNRDEIIQLALEADPFGEWGGLYLIAELSPETLERFAALVAAAEREACAKLLEDFDRFGDTRDCIAAIRARCEKGDV